ncbi:Cyclin-G2 [Holothuria leucospilota]|uniref:Cyclin-G2 n=1 Tax=Holothuria leucospilota TaxID=206669 RepID=A0A9Q1BLB5_HOLLE|nr:Cyclin-G2 [Holothuria leucospilota]
MHDAVMDRLRSLVRFYKLSSKSFFLTVSILDQFLSVVKVRSLHLMCASIAAFYMAVKIVEPKENVMSVKHLVRISQCGCLPNDLCRMEKIISNKINAKDLDVPTSNHFLQLYVSYCQTEQSFKFPEEEFDQRIFKLVSKLEACLCHFSLLQFRPRVLALSLLSHELPALMAPAGQENLQQNLSWIKVIWELQKIAQISDTELLYCRAQVADCLRRYSSSSPRTPYSKLVWTVSTRTARALHYTSKVAHHLPTIPECSSWRPEREKSLTYDTSAFRKSSYIGIQSTTHPVSSLGKSPLQDATNTKLFCVEPKRLFNYENSQLLYCPVTST